ncbi:MAG: porin [Acidiferrobacterales bacterium]|nr:porin [Acidiferrobacterales bacterium]
MNKKLIAAAVASTLAAPVVYADGHLGITPYGRINNAIDIRDAGENNTVDVSNVSSRFGFKGAGDIGNGLTAIGRYEFATTTDKEQNNVADLRLGYVGLSGGFGSVTIGNQWSAYFNHFGTIVSPTYSLGYYLYSSYAGGPFRTSNTIKYSNSFGPVSLDADLRLNESGEDNDVAEKLNGDGFGIGVTFNATDSISIAISADSEENNDTDIVDEETGDILGTAAAEDTDRFGIAGKFGFGPAALHIGHQTTEQGNFEVDHTQVYVSVGIGDKTSVLVGAGVAEDNGTGEADSVFLGAYHNLGGGLKLYLETTSVTTEDAGVELSDITQTLLGMRIDF